MDDQTDQNGDDGCLATRRGRREKKDKTGRKAALERLREAKAQGIKAKYEVVEEEDVYEEVDEEEYSRIVRERQDNDWIVDDDGAGYVEDGREIFDDDMDGGHEAHDKPGKKGAGGKKKQNPNIRAPDSKPKSIKSMFAAQAGKTKPKKESEVNLHGDELLGDIMSELHEKPSLAATTPQQVKLKRKAQPKAVVNPFSTKVQKRANPVKALAPLDNNKAEPKPEPKSEPEEIKPEKAEVVVARPKPQIRTALDCIDPDLVQSEPEEEIPEIPDKMDVSGIDFDDDFGEENTKPTLPDIGDGGAMWETVKGGGERDSPGTEIPADIQVDASQLPVTAGKDGEQVMRMYWIDAYEDQYKQPGVVYLFGKVWIESAKSYVSCCVAVKNIERKVFLLPRKTKLNPKTGEDTGKEVTFVDVYQEFNDHVVDKFKILKYKSRKVTREYAFEKLDVPAESEYMEVRYSAEFPQLPMDLQGETFSHVFGTNTSSLEILILQLKLKGPGWIDIKLPQLPSPAVSWCKVEAFVSQPEYVTVVPQALCPSPPPLVLMTLSLRTVHNPRTHQNEVVAAACLLQHHFHADKPAPKPPFQQHFCAVTKPNDCIFPFDLKEKVAKQSQSMKVEIMGTERALLGFLLAKMHKMDPDVIVGHDIFSFDLDVLLHRIQHNKIPHWSRIGRLKRTTMPKLSGSFGSKNSAGGSAACGRLVCDIQISAKELIRCRSYHLTELVSHVLKETRQELDPEQLHACFQSSASVLKLVEWTLLDASYILRLLYDLMVLPLALQITNICGNIMARTLMGGRAERNEYLLLHAFNEKHFIVPDKWGASKKQDDEKQNSRRRKPAYAGGLVLEPKKGFYDKFILLLDFNSLYPSIIQEYNICFTTINRTAQPDTQEGDEDEVGNLELPDQDLDAGILPTEIRKLVQSRRMVKQMMKEPNLAHDLLMQYDIRQKALKLTANSMYGCLGFSFSRFYAKPLAALVTGKGREILLKTKDLVQNMNLDVIYGDTDSIMVNTNSTDISEVYKLGNKVKSEVNKLYKLLEIDIDGVFKSMLLLKKKKYAALAIQKVGDKYVTSQELKGLDIVRRDWCELAKEAGNFVVSQILSGEGRETIVENIHSKLIEVGQKVNAGEIPVELYQITKALTKNPEDYPDKKSQPHVQVALRHNSRGDGGAGKKIRAGDTVYYVVCDDGSGLPPTQRAYSPAELAKSETLKIDTKYYLSQQVHPVVSRLCDPIDGTDVAHIAQCLGLDPSTYRQSMHRHDHDEEDAMLAGGEISDDEKYQNCDRFKFSCPQCEREIIFDGVFSGADKSIEVMLAKCPNVSCRSKPAEYLARIQNALTTAIRGHIKRYYEGWLRCEDSACGTRTRMLPLAFSRGHAQCHGCGRAALTPEYTDSELYTQLCFLQHIFDLPKAIAKENTEVARLASSEYQEAYKQLKAHVDHTIMHSAYSQVNLSRLFDGLFSLK